MHNKVTVIAQRQKSTMASYWTEYLCLKIGAKKKYSLFTGMYEYLDHAVKYYDEATENYNLPESINGKDVIRVDDDVVVGGDLDFFDPDDAIEFDTLRDPELIKWLADTGWNVDLSVILRLTEIT